MEGTEEEGKGGRRREGMEGKDVKG